MINKELEYTLKDGIYYPNIEVNEEKPVTLNKYGRMRLNFLKEHKKALYDYMLMNGTLSSHLESVQNEATRQVEALIDKLKATSELTEDMKNTEPLKWAGIMNTIKNQVEEIVIKELIYS